MYSGQAFVERIVRSFARLLLAGKRAHGRIESLLVSTIS